MNAGDSTQATALFSPKHKEVRSPRARTARSRWRSTVWRSISSDGATRIAISSRSMHRGWATKVPVAAATAEQLEPHIDWSAWLEEWDDSRSVLADMEIHDRVVDAMTEACFKPDQGEILTLPSGSFRLASPAKVGFDLPPPDPSLAAVLQIARHRSSQRERGTPSRPTRARRRARAHGARVRISAERRGEDRRGNGAEPQSFSRCSNHYARGVTRRLERLLAFATNKSPASTNERRVFSSAAKRARIIAGAIRRFRAEGPNRERREHLPPGVPSADSIAVQESAAADSLHSWIRSYSIVVPDLVRSSHSKIWMPRATKIPKHSSVSAKDQLAWAQAIRSTSRFVVGRRAGSKASDSSRRERARQRGDTRPFAEGAVGDEALHSRRGHRARPRGA